MYNSKKYWWQQEGDDTAEHVFDVVDTLSKDQRMIHNNNLGNYRFYNDTEMESLSLRGYTRPAGSSQVSEKVTFNVIKSMIDTLSSKITKSQPKCTFLTDGGDWNQQKKAKLLDKFVQGQFYMTKIYEIAPRICLDALVFGTGIMKVYSEDGEVKVDRVFPDELIVDDNEARYSEPRQMFQLKIMNREVLKGLFPEHEAKIAVAGAEDIDRSVNERMGGVSDDQLMCIESWHLPSSKGASDGKHAICCEDVCLLEEPYKEKTFPFVFLKYSERLLGFWGMGLSEMLTGIQREINTLLWDIQQSMNLFKPAVIIEGQVSKAATTNELGRVIELTPGSRYYDYIPRAIGTEWFSHLDRLFNRAYQIAGISELSAQSKKPVGLESGVALREFADIETERFLSFAKRYEAFFISSGEQMIKLARKLAKKGSYEVISHGDKSIEKIDWANIDLKDDQYVMQIYPTNFLPETPAGKMQFITELAQTGILSDNTELLKLLDYPDIDHLIQMKTAPYEIVDMMLDNMLTHGKYSSPEPFLDLRLAMEKTNQTYLRAKLQGAPEKRLNLLIRFLQETMEMISAMAMKQQQMAQEQMMAQQAPPSPEPPNAEMAVEQMKQEAAPMEAPMEAPMGAPPEVPM